MSAPARLHPADLERLGELVVDGLAERLEGQSSEEPRTEFVTAADIARRFGVSAEFVRDHADELGVVRIGTGPRPRLRFDPVKVEAALTVRVDSSRSLGPARPRRRPKSTGRPARTPSGSRCFPFEARRRNVTGGHYKVAPAVLEHPGAWRRRGKLRRVQHATAVGRRAFAAALGFRRLDQEES